MKDNKRLVPKRRFKEFEDDGDWEQRKLGEESQYFNGGSFEIHVQDNGKYELITLKSVDMNGTFISSGRYLDIEVPTLTKGTLVMILSEQSPGLLGMTTRIPRNNNYVLNQRVAEIKPNQNIDSYFLSMTINKSQPYFSKHGAGTKVQNISKPNVENFKFLCPSIDEQQRIGLFFEELDKLIILQQHKLEKIKDLKSSYLSDMFPKEGEEYPKIRFKGFTDIWKQCELRDIAEIIGGGTPSTSNSEYWDGDIDWYSPTEIGDDIYANKSVKTITQLGLEKSSANMLPPNNTVLFTSRAGIGSMAILTRTGATNQGFQSLVLKEGIDTYFVYSMGRLIKKYAEGNASGSTFLEISGKTLGKISVSVPSTDEQIQIGAFFKNLDNLIVFHNRKLEKLKDTKKAYLNEMFI